MFLFRVNGWLFYGVLIVSSVFNWDKIICNYNMFQSKNIETSYLLELSNTNLPQLILLAQDTTIRKNEFTVQRSLEEDNDEYVNETNNKQLTINEVSKRLYDFMQNKNELSWKSWYYDVSATYTKLLDLHLKGKINTLSFNGSHQVILFKQLGDFNAVIELQLIDCYLFNVNDLSCFSKLKVLNITNNYLKSLHGIEKLTQLEVLHLDATNFKTMNRLTQLKKLRELHVNGTLSKIQLHYLQVQLPQVKVIF